MALSVDHITRVITIPEADLTLLSPGLYELDTLAFRLLIRDLEDDPENMALPPVLQRNFPYTISGTTYADALFIINGFSLEFEDGQYTVLLKNSNNNFADVADGILVRNQVQVIPENSAGLISGQGSDPSAVADAVWAKLLASGTAEDLLVSTAEKTSTAAYHGSVHVDTKNGAPGVLLGQNGTLSNPVDNLADALTLLSIVGYRHMTVRGNITLTEAFDDFTIVGLGSETVVALNGQDVQDTKFIECELSGDAANSHIHASGCTLDGVTNVTGFFSDCRLGSSISLAPGGAMFFHCVSYVPGQSAPTIDVQGAGRTFNLRGYSGGVEVLQMSDPTNTGTIELVAGQVILGPTCTDGNLTIRGIGKLTDNSAGTTVVSTSLLNNDSDQLPEVKQIWNLSKGPLRLTCLIHLEIDGSVVFLPNTDTVDIRILDYDGNNVVTPLVGVPANAGGYFSATFTYTPTAGTNLAAFATVYYNGAVYDSVTPISVLDFS